MFTWIKPFIIAMAVAGGFVALALWLTPIVHADEGTYVNDLALLDVPVNPATIPLGHAICADISMHGYAGVNNQVKLAITSGIPTDQGAAIIVLAVQELCPSNTPALNSWMAQNR